MKKQVVFWLNMDSDLRNADWSKVMAWDWPVLPLTEEELVQFLATYMPDKTLDEFKKLPAYEGWQRAVARRNAGQAQER